MMRPFARLCFLFAALAGAGCGASGSPIAPSSGGATPNAAALPSPFAPLSFTVVPYGPQIVQGWRCYTGILTSTSQLPEAGARAAQARHAQGVFVPSQGCDDFPIPSPVPTPPGPAPSPLGSTTFSTAQITGAGLSIGLPSFSGWQGAMVFPACASTCDAGTSNGSVTLAVLPATTATSLALSLVFTNTGPENLIGAVPVSIRPAPHVYNLYGPPVAASASPQPMPTYVSGAPVTIGFPTFAVVAPVSAGVAPSRLALTLTQKLTPPVYEEAISNFDANGNPLPIPLTASATYRPYAYDATTAYFALPSTPFPFQTDFTEYDITLADS